MSKTSEKPTLAWIEIDKLLVDESYQRSSQTLRGQKNIEQISNNFNWQFFGALTVAKTTNDSFSVIDGQHRMLAAKQRGDISELPCIIVGEIESKEQAVSFSAINSNRVSLNSIAKYHAGIAAGDFDCIAIRDLLKKADIEIPKKPVFKADLEPRQTLAVGTIKSMLSKYSERQLIWALTIIPKAYGDEKGQLSANLIKTMALFCRHHEDIDDELAVYALQEFDPQELISNARSSVKIDGGTVSEAMLRAISSKYEKIKKRRSKCVE